MTVLGSIVTKVSGTVRRIFQSELPDNLFFHNINHTEDVVNAAIEIGSAINLSEEESEMAQIASWFHDVGYCYKYYGHEDLSIEIAERSLRQFNYPEGKLQKILSCIASTKRIQVPLNLIDQVIFDADFYHFSVRDYRLYEQRLRLEFQYVLGKTFTDNEWLDANCKLMTEHQYFTNYGQMVLQPNKDRNIQDLKCNG
ncbi:HD domain-containing protein [Daejeonella sp. JGW-45]|uniref:HD domain-containing protein n=1 Tax=Daejeonella sp. JGW-45 TaxID=3034148 RepID=UPI0023EDC35C|nr:HD domain-containing protein [Daejeonella sp. JGW-45]